MYQIAIYEDEKIFSEAFEKNCNQLCTKLKIDHTVTAFQNSKELLQIISTEPTKFDLFLLDIITDELSGMDLAKIIRKKNKESSIIFVTSNRDFAIQGYEVQALHYLLKPIDINLLEKLIDTDYKNKFKRKFITLETHTNLVKIAFSEIVALETVNRKVAVYLLDKTIYHTGKLSDLAEQLPSNLFIRCHQSFTLNIRNIREVDKKNATAVNGKIIPISRSHQKAIQKAFLEWMGTDYEGI